MQTITSRKEITPLLEECFTVFHESGLSACVAGFHRAILMRRVKFPILEFAAMRFYEVIPARQQTAFCDQVAALKTEGGNVILGILLQKRLQQHFAESVARAVRYIDADRTWYVSDIIGERVLGVSLLENPKKTLPVMKRLGQHPSPMVVRSLGASAHYAIKKGLGSADAAKVFELLLSLSATNDPQVKQGVGWAAKTTAKFHPKIIASRRPEIDAATTPAWFRTKIRIGLERNKHGRGNKRKKRSQ